MKEKFDFSGWASKNDIRCADGRTIRKDAFKDNDGKTVPLVWQHQHNDPSNVLGHALLVNKPEGMFTYGSFNQSDKANYAKMLLEHGDICSLSIYANQLKQVGGDVLHGNIREVSLVLAPANPGASIEYVNIAHSDTEEDIKEAIIYMDEQPELVHSDDSEPKEDDEISHSESSEEKEPENKGKEKEDMAEENKNEKEFDPKKVFETLNEEQKNLFYTAIGAALDEKDSKEDKEEEEPVKHNLFDNEQPVEYLTDEDYKKIFSDAKRLGSLKEAVMAHMDTDNSDALVHAVYNDTTPPTQQTYGLANINYLFPDHRNVTNTPEFIRRNTEWVNVVMNGVHHTRFSRIKSLFANITMDEARAKGYIKGNMKKEEVFSLLKRTTDPQTIYKKQKLDRDDIIDITDFDVVSFVKGEMRGMLDEEIARAILVGDGRLVSDDDHISEDHIRPIWKDASLFTITASVTGNDEIDLAKNFIRQAIKSRKDYKGSGNPILFTTEDMLTEMLLLEDGIGHMLYQNESQLATLLRVSKIVTVPVMENLTRTVDGNAKNLLGIIVNLNDYNVGADRGGEVNLFDDFDIDYNQQKYLIETRCSGALVKPYSAIVLETPAT